MDERHDFLAKMRTARNCFDIVSDEEPDESDKFSECLNLVGSHYETCTIFFLLHELAVHFIKEIYECFGNLSNLLNPYI